MPASPVWSLEVVAPTLPLGPCTDLTWPTKCRAVWADNSIINGTIKPCSFLFERPKHIPAEWYTNWECRDNRWNHSTCWTRNPPADGICTIAQQITERQTGNNSFCCSMPKHGHLLNRYASHIPHVSELIVVESYTKYKNFLCQQFPSIIFLGKTTVSVLHDVQLLWVSNNGSGVPSISTDIFQALSIR